MSKALKAYEVREPDEGHCVIRFATSSAAARREGANELNIDWDQVEHCARKPAFDQYAPGPVPPLVLLQHGWWFDCHCHDCASTVSLDPDDLDEDGDPSAERTPVAIGPEWIFCDAMCAGRHLSWVRGRAAAEAAMCELIYTRFPAARIKRVHVYGDRLERAERTPNGALIGGIPASADFELPGIKYSVSYHFGEPFHYVSPDDVDAFKTLYGAKP